MITTSPGSPRTLALALGVSALVAGSAGADNSLTEAQGRAAIAPFYQALNVTRGSEIAALVTEATSPDWVSCAGNDSCRHREQVIGGITGLHNTVPDLKWEIKEVMVAGNNVVVRGEASGTPSGEFMGANHTGNAFKVMSIDVHTIEGGKIVRSYHLEDWMGATRQLAAK